MEFTYSGLYADIEDQQHVQMCHWPPEATEDSVAEAACQHLQSTYMPEDVVVIAVQSAMWMWHEWPEAKVKIKETSRTVYVMVYRGLGPEMVDLLIEKQRMCAELKITVSKQQIQLHKLEEMDKEFQSRPRQARFFLASTSHCAMYIALALATTTTTATMQRMTVTSVISTLQLRIKYNNRL